ncbi:hypothetical protein HYH03_006653 [Edaphochlamys debaryana]|uniref:Phospholipid:diacylglycerol acyltransferase n=1 Tax=Edaphochlamys debaryana TaxID=47281 RepID=A0A836C063_9CHLO|nr:hypothetical protein HYH03_006653 [Edaphochlamys debaryana]|eukprot:KAG2495385.1 hypothetical protein HYH03_006653 [Edaphochlamys debaryana]
MPPRKRASAKASADPTSAPGSSRPRHASPDGRVHVDATQPPQQRARPRSSATAAASRPGAPPKRRVPVWASRLLTAAALAGMLSLGLWVAQEPDVSELLADSLQRLNATVPLPAALANMSLPMPSLDVLAGALAGAGGNASLRSLLGLPDSARLAEIGGQIAGGPAALTAQLRALVAALPAFSLPGAGGAGAEGGAAEAEAEAEEAAVRPGLAMARKGYRAKHPVVIVPGFVTSGLELWRGLPCGQRYFRQRMWGTLAMVQAFLTDAACWFRHMELDPVSGLDPEGIKVRAAVGLEAVDYFIQGYWVWGKLVEALADVGYDPNTLVSLPYDWRLAMPLLEERDAYFSRARSTIETMAAVAGERAVVMTHSYGENVVRSFMAWVEAEEPGWVEAHVEAVLNIAGTSLGVPKSVSALLSGETRDTAQLGALAGFLTSGMVPRAARTRVWRTWGSSYAMLPVGGAAVWGGPGGAPDDTPAMRAAGRTYGAMVTLWPHNWSAVLAEAEQAAAAAAPSAELAAAAAAASPSAPVREVVEGVAQDAASGTGAPAPGSSGHAEGGGGRAAASANASANATANATCVAPAECDAASNASGAPGAASPSPLARVTEQLRRLVGAGGVDPADYLSSDKISRLDVRGFLALLREVGGATVAAHVDEWGALPLGSGRAEQQADVGRRRSEDAAAAPTAGAEQSAGGAAGLAARGRHAALFPDATTTPLPSAPSTALYCLYGVGLPTERGYHYLRPPPPQQPQPPQQQPSPQAAEARAAAEAGAEPPVKTGPGAGSGAEGEEPPGAAWGAAGSGGGGVRPPPHRPEASGAEASPDAGEAGAGWSILKDVSHPESSLDVGVQLTDGDGTVPLLSLGAMCRGGWRGRGRLNPGPMRVVTREYRHTPVSLLQGGDSRGGPLAAAHIEILGNEVLLADVIRVAAGRGAEVGDAIVSDIDSIAAAIDWEAAWREGRQRAERERERGEEEVEAAAEAVGEAPAGAAAEAPAGAAAEAAGQARGESDGEGEGRGAEQAEQ